MVRALACMAKVAAVSVSGESLPWPRVRHAELSRGACRVITGAQHVTTGWLAGRLGTVCRYEALGTPALTLTMGHRGVTSEEGDMWPGSDIRPQ